MMTRILSVGKSRPVLADGFTLVELLVVLTIMSLVTGFALGFFDFGTDEVFQAATTVQTMASSARSQAMLRKRQVSLVLTGETFAFQPEDVGRRWTLPRGVSVLSVKTEGALTKKEGRLVFGAKGITRPAVITLHNGSSVFSVSVPSAGAAKVFSGEVGPSGEVKEW